MKTLVFGDIHGRSLEPLEDTAGEIDPDRVLCTCDFDTPEAVKQFKEFEREMETRGVEVFKVPGNHDDAVFRGLDISSPTLRQQGLTVPELHQRLRQEEEAELYLKNLLAETRKRMDVAGRDALLVHGALSGDLRSYPSCPQEKQDFWRRLLSREDHRENFEAMEEAGVELMVRGHDHEPEIASHMNEEIRVERPSPGESFELGEGGSLHTVTHGAWFNGWYTVIRSHPPEITFSRF